MFLFGAGHKRDPHKTVKHEPFSLTRKISALSQPLARFRKILNFATKSLDVRI